MKANMGIGDDGRSYIKDKKLDKDSEIFEAIGDIDELISLLGMVRALTKFLEVNEVLKDVQKDLFRLNSHLARFRDEFGMEGLSRIEAKIKELSSSLPEVKKFVLPGGPFTASLLHLSRAVCRRAERRVVSLSKRWQMDKWVIPYMNRLSSLLFVLARYETIKNNVKEEVVDSI